MSQNRTDLNKQGWWIAVGKAIAVLVALIVLFRVLLEHRPDMAGRSPGWLWLGASLFLVHFALLLISLRLRLLLKPIEIRLSIVEAIRIHLQSLFYYFFVPMSVGMEVARFIKLRSLHPGRSAGLLGVFLIGDRLAGMIGAAIVCVMLLGALPEIEIWPRTWLLFLAIGGGILILSVLGARFLSKHWSHLEKVSDIVRQRPLWGAQLIGLSVLSQLAIASGVFLAARGLHLEIGWGVVVWAYNASTLVMSIPVSLLGAGPGEAANLFILKMLDMSLSDAALIVALGYTMRLVGAIEGGVWELLEAIRTPFLSGR